MAFFQIKFNSDFPAAANALPNAAFELVCPAGSLPALKAAVDNGASCVYLSLRDATNARNFDEAATVSGITHTHKPSCKVFMALNTYPQAANPHRYAPKSAWMASLGAYRRPWK